MSAPAAEAAAFCPSPEPTFTPSCPAPGGAARRRQRVKVPMRLVASAYYQDVALAVYVKVKALAARPERCEARTATIAGYLGLSSASVERGLKQLYRPGPDGVVELRSQQRTLPGGRGQSARRWTRPMPRTEAYVWLPVAASEDLTPRQLRVYALISYAQDRGIPVAEAELAASLHHHSGARAGQRLTVTAASAIVDAIEDAGWLTVHRRAGERGRHLYIAHDLPGFPPARHRGPENDGQDEVREAAPSSPSDEGAGSPAGEGVLAYEESPRPDPHENGGETFPPAVGDLPEVPREEVGPAAASTTDVVAGSGRGALRAGGHEPSPQTAPDRRTGKAGQHRPRQAAASSQRTLPAWAHAVLEPVQQVVAQVSSTWVLRRIEREIATQLDRGMSADRLHHRLTARFAGFSPSEIRDPERWLLGVALPRWGCGHVDCESGVMWSTGRSCDVCDEVKAANAARRERERLIADGRCPDHGHRLRPSGICPVCELDRDVHQHRRRPLTLSAAPAPRSAPDTPYATCGECQAKTHWSTEFQADGLCRTCRADRARTSQAAPAPAPRVPAQIPAEHCVGTVGAPCARPALPSRTVCARHRAQQLAEEAS